MLERRTAANRLGGRISIFVEPLKLWVSFGSVQKWSMWLQSGGGGGGGGSIGWEREVMTAD